MATFSCYSCLVDLSNFPKERVIIRNKKIEYSCLYDIAVGILETERKDMSTSKIHQTLDGLLCKRCCSILKKYSAAVTTIEPIKKRIKDLLVDGVSISMI